MPKRREKPAIKFFINECLIVSKITQREDRLLEARRLEIRSLRLLSKLNEDKDLKAYR
jgi:hypothetical protein